MRGAAFRPADFDRNHYFVRSRLFYGNLSSKLAARIGGAGIINAGVLQIAAASRVGKNLAPIIQARIRTGINAAVPRLAFQIIGISDIPDDFDALLGEVRSDELGRRNRVERSHFLH